MIDEASDSALAARAGQGDRRAYGLLVRRHGAALAQTARALGLPESDVDDAVQEAFIAAWRNLSSYDPGRPFRAWLFRIALNKIRDIRRHRRVRAFLFGAAPLADHGELADDTPDPQRSAMAALDLARIRQSLDTLDASLREPLVLTALVGMSQPEAAAVLGISAKAVETRVARGRGKLAGLLAEKNRTEGEGDIRCAT